MYWFRGYTDRTIYLEGLQRMYSLKERKSVRRAASEKPILAAKRRRQLHPFFFSMGPVALSIVSVLLIGLMAVLYLSQLGQAVAANQHLQDIRFQQAALARDNQDMVDVIAQEQSPAYIAEHAKALGLVPADPKDVRVLLIHGLVPMPSDERSIAP
jgi:hypothetical protein